MPELDSIVIADTLYRGNVRRVKLLRIDAYNVGDPPCKTGQEMRKNLFRHLCVGKPHALAHIVLPLLRPGGLILADDVLWSGKVYTEPVKRDAQTAGLLDFNDMVSKDRRVEVVILPLRDGISLIRKK